MAKYTAIAPTAPLANIAAMLGLPSLAKYNLANAEETAKINAQTKYPRANPLNGPGVIITHSSKSNLLEYSPLCPKILFKVIVPCHEVIYLFDHCSRTL